MQSPDPSQIPNGTFPRIPSESSLTKTNSHEPGKPNKPWERSQSALDLENTDLNRFKSASVDYGDLAMGGKVSEQSKVYWDLSKTDDDICARHGKYRISLQTIHQKEEMKTSGSPSVSIQARLVRRMASETSLGTGSGTREFTEMSLSGPGSPTTEHGIISTPSPTPTTCSSTTHTSFSFSHSNQQKPNLTLLLASALPQMKENIRLLRAPSPVEQSQALTDMLVMVEQAWATPTVGRDLAYGLCDVLRDDGALEMLIHNCAFSTNQEIQLASARVLEQSMTVTNRDEVASKGLEVIVHLAKNAKVRSQISVMLPFYIKTYFEKK